jgi:hypothetical protein
MMNLDSQFATKKTILNSAGCAALACVDGTMPLRHGASLATMLWPDVVKVRRIIAAGRTQTRVLD